MWSIELLENDVKVPAKVAKKLYESSCYPGVDYGDTWDDLDSVLEDGHLFFNGDHFEHMDYLSNDPNLVEILKRAKVKGRILFRSTEGDNAGEYWGHEFDGKGGYQMLIGTESITWSTGEK